MGSAFASMRKEGRRGLSYAAPSLIAPVVGIPAAAVVEGARSTAGLLPALAAAGFSAIAAVPVAAAAGLAVRGLWRAWRPRELAARLGDPEGGAPRLAGWCAYVLVAGPMVFAASYSASRWTQFWFNSEDAIAIGTAIGATAAAAVLAAGSRPAVRALAAVARALGAARRPGAAGILAASGGVVVLECAAAWVWFVSPRIGTLDIAPLAYPAAALAVMAAIHAAWPALSRSRARAVAAVGVAIAIAVALVGCAGYARYARPMTMLAVWGNAPLAGRAIDALVDVNTVRRDIAPAQFRPPRREGAPVRDVVLITVDTMRASRTPIHGGPARMPALEAFADQSAVFEWAFSPGNVTRRSLPAIAIGASPTRIEGRVAGWALQIDPRHVLLAERFAAAGYDTAGFFCCGSQFAPRHELGLIRGVDHLAIEYDGKELAARAARWVRRRNRRAPERPLFLWLHFIEPHNWESDHPAKDHQQKSLKERYDLSLAATDRFLDTVLDAVWLGRRDRTVVAITSDHGEGLGDHGQRYHAGTLYNAEIRVPLVVHAPGAGARRIERAVDLVDLPPTLLDLAGFAAPGMPAMDGASLAPLIRGEVEDRPAGGEAFSVIVPDRSVDEARQALVRGHYKLIVSPGEARVELYDLDADPGEENDLSKARPDVVRDLQRELSERRRRIDSRPAF